MHLRHAAAKSLRLFLLLVAAAALAAACDDDGGNQTPADTTTGTDGANDAPDATADGDATSAPDSDDDGADLAPDTVEPTATVAYFDLDGELSGRDGFYQLPWPSDARTQANGLTDISALGNPPRVALFDGLMRIASELRGYPTMPVAWFRFTGPLATLREDVVIPAEASSPILLIDIDPESDRYGTLFPTVARTLTSDSFVPTNVLGVAPRPGFVLPASRTYAFVVRTGVLDAAGEPLGVPEALAEMAAGGVPEGARAAAVAASLEPLWPALDALGVPRSEVAAATAFTVGDETAENFELSERVRERFDTPIESVAFVQQWDRYCQLEAAITVPEFQDGTPPYAAEGGLFVYDDSGDLVMQREVTLPVTLTIPRREMPADGFPLTVYVHGSGGVSTECVDRGPRETADGPQAPGEGPAYVVAEHGIAMACTAMPVNPQRVPGAGDQEYIQLANPQMMRDNMRQGVIEQRLFLDALLELRIDPEVLAGCEGVSLPDGESAYRFRSDRIALQGQSMGGMYTNLVGAIEPRFTAVVPTGAAGHWSYFITVTTLLDAVPALELLLRSRDLTFLHPTMQVMQMGMMTADPVASMPRLARRPLPGHPSRSIYEPVGKDDRYFPTELFDAVALAYEHPMAGEEVWPSMQEALALKGLDGLIDYPVRLNLSSDAGEPYTGVAVQYEGNGIEDPHTIYVSRPEVRYQYGCFLETYFTDGVAVVPEPAPLGTPCPRGP